MTGGLKLILVFHTGLHHVELGFQVLVGCLKPFVTMEVCVADCNGEMFVGGLDGIIQVFGRWYRRFGRHWGSQE